MELAACADSLQELNFSECPTFGIPNVVFRLRNLQKLMAPGVGITELPEDIGTSA